MAWQGVDSGPCGTVVLVHHPKASKHIPQHPDPLDCRAPGGFRSGSRTPAALEGRLDQRYPPETRIKGFTVHSSAPKHSRSQNETLASHRRPLRGIKALRTGYFALVGGVLFQSTMTGGSARKQTWVAAGLQLPWGVCTSIPTRGDADSL